MRRLSGLDASRLQIFEIRAKGGKGKLHFDFGRISEDINGNGQKDHEDQILPDNYQVDKGEDIGLDFTPDELEYDRCGNAFDSLTNPDPAGFHGVPLPE